MSVIHLSEFQKESGHQLTSNSKVSSLRNRTKGRVLNFPSIETDTQEYGLFLDERRLGASDVGASDFFDALVRIHKVTISNPGDEISAGSILKISDTKNAKYELTYEMSVADFVRLTEEVPKSTTKDKLRSYVLTKLSIVPGISIGYEQEGNATLLRDFIEDDTDDLFRPEEISITWKFKGGRGLHWMLFPIGNATPIIITPEDLDEISSPMLLDMLCSFREEMKWKKYTPKA